MDHDGLDENPLLTKEGQSEIQRLSDKHQVSIPSLTGDCFMQAPFYKVSGAARQELIKDFRSVMHALGCFGGGIIIFPLVDGGSIKTSEQEVALLEGLKDVHSDLVENGVRIGFESDLEPEALKRFMHKLPEQQYGVNYDIGNSASLGFESPLEIAEYGDRIINVHVKDRLLGGTTVHLGQGAANFPLVFEELVGAGYNGPYILQSARATDGHHFDLLVKFRQMVLSWIIEARIKVGSGSKK